MPADRKGEYKEMKILHTADWHIGLPKSPYKDGVNLRLQDTIDCLDELRRVAAKERPDYTLVSGDIFDTAEVRQARGHKEVLMAREAIMGLSKSSFQVIVMRGTPNHDSAEAFEELKAHFSLVRNVHIITMPQVLSFGDANIAVLPGFDKGEYRAKFPGLSREDENAAFTKELSNIVLGLKAQCIPDSPSILMAHYTVPGCDTESGQVMMLGQFEPMLSQEALQAAGFDLVALGHIHRPQAVPGLDACYYSGAINQMNFNDEGQERGFWIHGSTPDGGWKSTFHKTPYRECITLRFAEEDVSAVNLGDIEEVACSHWRYNGAVQDRIVRILYRCSEENARAYKMKQASIERALLEDGAFMLWENLPETGGGSANRTELTGSTDPEENLIRYLEEKQMPPERIQELVLRARPIIASAEADMPTAADTGVFEPVEISVENYRNYEKETFNFEGITFCTVNGQNGAGKSSLFMDAILDCLYEDPREGELTGWVRNDDAGCTGMIRFTFRVGEKVYRITRTRTLQKKGAKKRTGKGSLNLSELVDGQWEDRAGERAADVQKNIVDVIGMDSFTFRSCALIMQDQYGLFLQARPEERGEALGSLLGLGIYRGMERIAQDMAKAYGAKARELGHKIEVQRSALDGLGDPEEGLSVCQERLQTLETTLQARRAERDERKLELLSLQEAQERCDKLSEAISSLTAKKTTARQNRDAQAEIITDCQTILDTEQRVMEKAERYRALGARKSELIEGAALFGSKQLEVSKAISRVSALGSDLAAAREKLEREQARLAEHEDTFGDAEILQNAERYQSIRASLDDMQALALEYQKADQRVQAARAAQRDTEKEIEANDDRIISTRDFLGKDIAILSDDCGCIDIEKADCRFLAKAKASKGVLQEEEVKYQAKKEGLEHLLAQRISAVAAAASERDGIAYDAGKKAEAERLCAELLPYVARAEQVRKKVSEIALVRASVENAQSNVSDIEKRLAEADAEASRAKEELEQYRGAFDENKKVSDEMQMLSPWIEQEKQLPVIRERLTNAMQRLSELDLQITELEAGSSEKQLELSKEILKTTGLAEKQAEIEDLDAQIGCIEGEAKTLQTEIGALQQTIEQASKLKREIKALQEEQTGYAKETADHEALRAAFSQDGVPHQIIRSMIPQLTDIANTILGQMTGGKMGVEFRLERVQGKREKASLDIFIEEYGRSVLPYLSKSGGEKVKASLAVILALAEIRSSAAGVQLGFLQIDEPPFLDSDGTQAYVDALEAIHQRYAGLKVIAITHDQEFKARFPQSVTVYKDEHGSHVVQG